MRRGPSPVRSRLRVRTAALLAPLVMLTSASLGVVASPADAQAAPPPTVAAPVFTVEPASPASERTPTWSYDLPDDPAPVVAPSVSDSSTVTTSTDYEPESVSYTHLTLPTKRIV